MQQSETVPGDKAICRFIGGFIVSSWLMPNVPIRMCLVFSIMAGLFCCLLLYLIVDKNTKKTWYSYQLSPDNSQRKEEKLRVMRADVRTKEITEATHELGCERCDFYNPEKPCCNVPLGTCVYRAINGIPGHYVGDLLEKAGLIGPGWDRFEDHTLSGESRTNDTAD